MPSAPRVVAAQINHQTNGFSSVLTDLAAFEATGLFQGEEIARISQGASSAFGGFFTGAARHGFDLLPILAAWATPAGRVTGEAFAHLSGLYLTGLKRAMAMGPVAGVLLALHGSMMTESEDDADGLLLELTRQTVGDATPIVATIGVHATISRRMVDAASILIASATYPTVDMHDRAEDACGLLSQMMRREIQPVAALRKPPMLIPSQRMTTDRVPMRSLIDLAERLADQPRVLNVSLTGGSAPADIADAGVSVLVTTDNAPDLAASLADELVAALWAQRDGFIGGVAPFPEVAQALRRLDSGDIPGTGPLVLVDIADNPWSGGPGDSAELVRFLIQERVAGAAVALVNDPAVVETATAAGPRATITVDLGGKIDRLHGDPLPVRAYVRLLSDGRYVNEGPVLPGLAVDLGPTAVLVCSAAAGERGPGVEVLVTSRAASPVDLNLFRAHGIEPTRRRVLGLKGMGHFRIAFEPIARRVVLVEGPGITGADHTRLHYTNIRRPMWPLDPITGPLPAPPSDS